jgi:hypothetical protein
MALQYLGIENSQWYLRWTVKQAAEVATGQANRYVVASSFIIQYIDYI